MSKRSFVGGLAIFAMFFGSGNLIFPLIIGKEARAHWFISTFGLGITGVILPLIGLLTMLLIRNDMEFFFQSLFNKFGSYAAAIIVLLICGPLGVIPRCITVAEGSWKTFSPNHGNILFIAVCCLIIWCSVYFKNNIIDLIGKYFTPIKLIGLLTIIFSSIFVALKGHNSYDLTLPTQDATTSLLSGLINGYGTMDLFAALFFGPTIVAYFIKPNLTKKQINKECMIAMIFGFLIIFFVYSCLIYLGASYSSFINNTPETEILPKIVHIALGNSSYYIISLTLIVATLITAIALTSVTVEYITTRVKLLNKSRTLVLNVSLIITFIFSALGFSSIMSFLMPILKILYPLTILILALNIFNYFKKRYFTRTAQSEHNKQLTPP